jgi:hypothetical protein
MVNLINPAIFFSKMSELIANLTSENKDYLWLLTHLVRSRTTYRRIDERGLEMIVNTVDPLMDDKAKDKLLEYLAPIRGRKASFDPFEEVRAGLEKDDYLLKGLLDFIPSGEFANPFQELLYAITWHPETYQNVDVRQYRPEFVRTYMACLFKHHLPEAINQLEPNSIVSMSNMYFAALQLIHGLPVDYSDRLTENIFNIVFLDIDNYDSIGRALENFSSKTRDHEPALELLMRLPSEYHKAMLYYGNIVRTEKTAYNFLIDLADTLKKNERDLWTAFKQGVSISDHTWYSGIETDIVEFIARISPRNIDRYFRTFSAKTYDDVKELLTEALYDYPLLAQLNILYVDEDVAYHRLAQFIVNSTETIKAPPDDINNRFLRDIQGSVLDNYHKIFANLPDAKDCAADLFGALKGQKRVPLTDTNSFTESAYYLATVFEEHSGQLIRDLLSDSGHFGDISASMIPVFRNARFKEKFVEYSSSAERRLPLLTFFANFGSDISDLTAAISADRISLHDVDKTGSLLQQNGIVPTPHLISHMIAASEHNPLTSWQDLLKTRFHGRFDTRNLTHTNLGYTQFSSVLKNRHFMERVEEKFRFTWNFDSYRSFMADQGKSSFIRNEQMDFEVDCAAYESSLLSEFISTVKTSSDMLGRELLVVPNLTNGYLPIVPLFDDLVAMGIKVYLGAKIGSTECHNNPSAFRSDLFSGLEEYLLQKKPIVLIVDATQHLLDRNTEDQSARYPDAYQGYLNYAIALNYVSGIRNRIYALKNDEDVQRLEKSNEFNRFLERQTDAIQVDRTPYDFYLWNTAGLPLIIRNDRKKVVSPSMASAHDLSGPSMIFCNVGVLDSQIPASIREQYGSSLEHTPAFFDDKDKIIEFELRLTGEGVTIHNELETLIRHAYQKYAGSQFSQQSIYFVEHPNRVVK